MIWKVCRHVYIIYIYIGADDDLHVLAEAGSSQVLWTPAAGTCRWPSTGVCGAQDSQGEMDGRAQHQGAGAIGGWLGVLRAFLQARLLGGWQQAVCHGAVICESWLA